jgi:hypothetical protein
MSQRILLVEPNTARREALTLIVAGVADVDACADFVSARRAVAARTYELLVTQLRLGPYNGVHLVYLARPSLIRSVVYSAITDAVLARDVQAAGAFYETEDRLPFVLVHYVMHPLPPIDRRDPAHTDRRGLPRGGRRVTDVALLARSAPQ